MIKKIIASALLMFSASLIKAEITGLYTFPGGSNGDVQIYEDGYFGGRTLTAGSNVTITTNSTQITISATGGGGGGSGTSIRFEDGGSFVVTSSTMDFDGTQFNVTNNGGEALAALDSSTVTLKGNTFNTGSGLVELSGGLVPNSLVDGSSITKQGLLVAGSNVTLTPGAGTLTIAATAGSGDIESVTAGPGLSGGGTSGAVTVELNPNATHYIHNQDTLQSGATFYVSSGTVAGPFSVYANSHLEYPVISLPTDSGIGYPSLLIDRRTGNTHALQFSYGGANGWRLIAQNNDYFTIGNVGSGLNLNLDITNNQLELLNALSSNDIKLNFNTSGNDGSIIWNQAESQFDLASSMRIRLARSLIFSDNDFENYVAFKASNTISTSVTWTLPDGDGSSGQVLHTDGSGNLYFDADDTGGGGGTTIWGQDDEAVVSNAVSTITVNGVLKSTVTATNKMAVFLNYDTNQFSDQASTFTANTSSFTMYGPNIPASAISAGSLGASVLASSIAASGVSSGYFPNANVTVNPQGQITTISTGTFPTSVGVRFYNGGSALSAGATAYVQVPTTFTVTSWSIYSQNSCSASVVVMNDTEANFPPTLSDAISGTEKPSLSAQTLNTDTNLTTWTTTEILKKSFLAFYLESVSTCTDFSAQLFGTGR